MTKIHYHPKTVSPKIGLALSGGAPRGAIFEIGALKALNDAIIGLDLNKLGIYVGVSAGGFLAACLANQLTPDQMCRAIIKAEPGEHPFVPENFFKPAFREYALRLRQLPALSADIIYRYLTTKGKSLTDSLIEFSKLLPVGLFDNSPIQQYVEKIFSIKGRTNSFTQLKTKLFIIATDLESSQIVTFGSPGYDQIPISKAIQATTALPGLYPPVRIKDHYYVDGILNKTTHAGAALATGVKLVFAVNAIVPVDLSHAFQQRELKPGLIVRSGLVSVLTQTVLSMIHSRMQVGLKAYKDRYPDADVIVIEPPQDDHELFFSNIFSFDARCRVCSKAYAATLVYLCENEERITPILKKHGLKLNRDLIKGNCANIWTRVSLKEKEAKQVMCLYNG